MSNHHIRRPPVIDELVYGSARQLLSSSASDLGVIASTPDFPAALARELSGRRAACPMAADGSERNRRCFLGRAGAYLEVSRVEPGLDHTGRSVAFAHHLVCHGDLVDSGDAVSWQVLAKLWSECRSPQTFEAGYLPQKQLDTGAITCPPLPVEEAVFIRLVEYTLAAAEAGNRTIVVLPEGDDVLTRGVELVVWLFLVLPASVREMLFAAINVADETEWNPEVSLFVTEAGTRFATQARERASAGRGVWVIDAARAGAASTGVESNSPFGDATRRDLHAGTPGRFARLSDEHSVGANEYDQFGSFVAMLDSFQAAPSVQTLESLHRALAAGAATTIAESVEGLYVQAVDNALRKHGGSFLESLQNTANGTERLAASLEGHHSLIHLLLRLGVLAEGKKLYAKASAVAEVLLQLGDEATTHTVSGRGDPAVQAFNEKYLVRKEEPVEFDELPLVVGGRGELPARQTPSGRMVSQMPPVHAGMRTAGGPRSYQRGPRKPAAPVRLIPSLAVLLCAAACALPFAWEMSLGGGDPASVVAVKPQSPQGEPGEVEQADLAPGEEPLVGMMGGEAGEQAAMPVTRQGTVGTVLEEHFLALVISLASLGSAILVAVFYSPLSVFLGTRIAPSATLLAPVVLTLLVVASNATMVWSIYSTRLAQGQANADPANESGPLDVDAPSESSPGTA